MSQVRLLLELYRLQGNITRVKINELKPLKPRYEVPDVLIREPTTEPWVSCEGFMGGWRFWCWESSRKDKNRKDTFFKGSLNRQSNRKYFMITSAFVWILEFLLWQRSVNKRDALNKATHLGIIRWRISPIFLVKWKKTHHMVHGFSAPPDCEGVRWVRTETLNRNCSSKTKTCNCFR